MNKYKSVALLFASLSTLCITQLSFADTSGVCGQAYIMSEGQFDTFAQAGNPAAISAAISNCMQNNYCATAADPLKCMQNLPNYDSKATYFAVYKAELKKSASNPFGQSLGSKPPAPKSSYNFTYHSPIKSLGSNNNPSAGSGLGQNLQPKNIYKNINF